MHIYTILKNRFSFFKKAAKHLSLLAIVFMTALQASAQVPLNDDPCNGTAISAIPLTVSASCTYTTYSNVDASLTAGVTTPSCGNLTGADVWFTVTIPVGSNAVTIDSKSIVMQDGAAAAYTATGTCPNLTFTEVSCADDNSTNFGFPKITVSGVSGQVFYIRFWGVGGEMGSFGICATANIVPNNDDCTNAINLTVNPDYLCAVSTTGTTVNATQSTNLPNPTCGAVNGWNDDVWYKFTATTAAHRVTLTGVSGGTSMTMVAYSGTCAALTQVGCINGNTLDLAGLTIGATYYVRVYTNVTTAATTATFTICVGTAPPPPGNDDCANATALTVNADLNCGVTTAGTTTSATQSSNTPGPTCGTVNGWNDDVWYSFVATGTSHRVSLLSVSGGTSMTMAVYSGTCGALTQVGCANANVLNLTGLTVGATYLVRVYTNVATVGTAATFNICVGSFPAAPANDECAGAISLTVNSAAVCTVTTAGTTVSATQSATLPAPTCGTANAWDDDVWYSFVATGVGHSVSLSNVAGDNTNMVIVAYSGTCGALTQIGCANANLLNLAGLTIGNTYYVRVYNNVTTAQTYSTFNICVTTAPPAPSNDDCAGAISLTVNNDQLCAVTTAGTTVSATQSTTLPNPTCGTANAWNDDVWYSFVATGATHRVTLSNVAGGSTNMVIVAYSGTCAALTQIGCANANVLNLTGLTAGTTYLVRVYNNVTTAFTYSTFNICIGTPPPAPVNDDPCNAIVLPVTASCTYQIFSNESATSTTGVPAPGCASYNGQDVWFQAVVPASGNIAINSQAITMNDGGMAIYSGTCSNLTLIECNDDGSTNPGLMPYIIRKCTTGLTPGSTIWIRFWAYNNNTPGSFGICVTDPALTGSGPGAICSSAQTFCTSSTYTFPNSTGQPSLGGGGIYGCLGTSPNPVFYYMQIANPGNLIFNISQTGASGGLDVDFALWGPFTSLSDGCSQLNALCPTITPISCSYSTAAVETATITGAQTGQFYIILITNFSNQTGTITFNQTGGTGTTNCNIVCNATATNSGPVCPSGTFNLTGSSSIGGSTYGWTGPGGFTSNQQNPTNVTAPATVGNYVYTLTVTSGNNSCTGTTTLVVTASSSVTLTSAAATTNQSVCTNSAITNITYAVTGATGATATGLPAGVTGTFAGGVFTINGSPTTVGTYNYTVTTSGGCGSASQTGTITVTPGATLTLGEGGPPNQTICLGNPISNIAFNAGNGATGATVTGLPPGVTGNYFNGVFTISSTPTTAGVYNYTVSTTGGCGVATQSGVITVNSTSLTLTSAAATANQTVCVNTAITNITYAAGNGATGATASGLPPGVNGVYAGGVFTISGTPTATGVYNYTVNTTGGCGVATISGTITVSNAATITLSSAAGTNNQSICITTAIANITYTIGGSGTGATVTGLPAGVTGVYAGGVFTISGTPTATGTFNYTVTTSGGCGASTQTGTIIVRPAATLSLTSAAATANQTVCINTPITNIVYTPGNGATNITVTGLPAGVTGFFNNATMTISGTPAVSGVFNYTVTTSGGCGVATLTGTITVTAVNTLTLTSAAGTSNQAVCVNTAITNITYGVTGGTGATVTGLPAGVTGTYAGGVVTISGTPTASGVFNYTVSTTGGCGVATQTGTITVSTASTVTLTSAAATSNQTVCINSAITNITYAISGGATGAAVSGLPAGVTGTYAAGVFTISGTPTASGVFNYTVSTTGGCGTPTQSGTITVTAANTLTLSSAAGTSAQSVCVNSAITNITYTVTGGTGATVTGLPAGVTGTYAGGVVTISGTPTGSGTFNYTVSTTGGCGVATQTGSIIVGTNSTLVQTSSEQTSPQTVCRNSTIANIVYAAGGGATGATATGLPAGVTGTYAAGVFTISGIPTVSGQFNFTVSTTGGCGTATRSGTINVTPGLTANAGNPVTIASGTQTQLNGTGTAGANYLWTANGPLALSSATILNPIASPLQTTTYTLTVSDPLSICPSASSSVIVTVVTTCINVRNAFTPNGDGINDLWLVYDQNFCLTAHGVTVNVYNRYGSKVYESKDYNNTWDGTYHGKAVPDGTYYAVVDFVLSNGDKKEIRTDVTVLR